MISRISGRYISFYADDLASMLLDDILVDTVKELEVIEKQTRKVYVGEESKVLAEDMLVMISSYQNDVHTVMNKWSNCGAIKEQLSKTVSNL